MEFRDSAAIEAGLAHVREAPRELGQLMAIVSRPAEGKRTLLEEGVLDLDHGLIGDSWHLRPSSRGPDGGPNPEAQVTLMGARTAALVSGSSSPERWSRAGDQLFVDFDLSEGNLPSGSRLRVGNVAVLEITAEPHTGCGKFARRFGVDALKAVNTAEGRSLRLRGANARVLAPGAVRVGDAVARAS